MMENNKKILFNFSLYFLTLLLIIIVGISNVFADTYYTNFNYRQQYFDNNGSSVSKVTTTWTESFASYVSNNITTSANSYGAGLSITSPIPILQNHTYTLSIFFEGTNNLAVSSKCKIAISTSLDGAAYNYADNNFYVNTLNCSVSNNSILQFVFTATSGGQYLFFPWTTTSTTTQDYVLTQINISDLGSEGISQSQINNSLNNQTNIINNSITASTNTITENSNNNRQAIIDNQNANNDALIENDNANTDKIIEENKKNFNSCHDSINLLDEKTLRDGAFHGSNPQRLFFNSNKYLEAGTYTLITTLDVSKYKFSINISSEMFPNYNIDIYNSYWITNRQNFTFTINQNGYFGLGIAKLNDENITKDDIKNYTFMLYKGSYDSSITYEEYGKEICVNKLDEQKNAINNLDNSLKDDNTDEATSEASDFFGNFNTNTFGLTSIITAPLNLIQSLTSKTCAPLHLPLPYLNNKYLDLPCMSSIYSQHFGAFFTLYQTITYGIIAYWVCVRIFNHVKDFKNPEHDEIEVVDL